MKYTIIEQLTKGSKVIVRLINRSGPNTAALTAVAVFELHNVQACTANEGINSNSKKMVLFIG